MVVCKNCRSTNLFFVSEYHKSWICIILKWFLIALAISTILKSNVETFMAAVSQSLIYLILLAVTMLVKEFIESRTHIQAICKDCGCVWTFKW